MRFTWNQHANSNVQYRVYRKSLRGSPALITTKAHHVTSYTDALYSITDGGPWQYMSWDIRAYYTTEQTEAAPVWHTKSVEIMEKRITEGAAGMPEEFSIRNHPNPFNPSTTIQVAIPKEAPVLLKVYDLLGREVAELVKGDMAAGYHQVPWSGVDHSGQRVPTGIYIAVLVSPQYTKSIKMLLLE